MSQVLAQALGWAVVLLVGVPLSIALHEIGHLVPAKRFGIKCTQYMIGFGPTVWSRRRGETEYGLKAFPLGGYVRMIGMYPPRSARRAGRASTGRWTAMIEQARDDARAEVGPGDDDRQFYQRSVPKRIVVMLGGPFMNLVLAVLMIGGILTLYGQPQLSTKLQSISTCVLPADAQAGAACKPEYAKAPAVAAGLQPDDRITRFAGQQVTDWTQIRDLIRSNGGRTVPVTVDRGGRSVDLSITPLVDQRPKLDANGAVVRDAQSKIVTEAVGFAGVTPAEETVRQPVSAVPGVIWAQVAATGRLVADFPAKLVGVAKAAAGVEKRDPNGPVSVVGVARLGGEIAAAPGVSIGGKIVGFVGMLAGLNLALFLLNLLPLLPLDGGHVAGALWEGARRGAARLLRRPDPGPVDTVRALPLVYAVASLLLGVGLLLIYADLVAPISVSSQ